MIGILRGILLICSFNLESRIGLYNAKKGCKQHSINECLAVRLDLNVISNVTSAEFMSFNFSSYLLLYHCIVKNQKVNPIQSSIFLCDSAKSNHFGVWLKCNLSAFSIHTNCIWQVARQLLLEISLLKLVSITKWKFSSF